MARRKQSSKRVEPRFEDEPTMRAPKRQSRKKKAKRSLLWRIMRPATYWGVVLGLWGFIAVAGIVGFYAVQLPSASTWAVPERPANIRIVAKDGSLLANRGATGGENLRLEDMSPHIPQAVIAIEDRRFHSHFGFDPIGFTRAMMANVALGKARQGGSTLTQQLAKNLFLTQERTIGRKVQELVLAFWLEAKYSKADILELYLNRVYFGAGATGVDAAARRYFGKSAKHVTIAEAAMLAGLLKAPSRLSPSRSPKAAQARARVVLAAMQREGFVKPGALDFDAVKPGENARHFRSGPQHFIADHVAKRVDKLLGKIRRDVTVETTIDPYLLTAAQSSIEQALDKHGQKRRVSQAALVSLAPNGAIRSLIGGRDYAQSQFDRVRQAARQPGSAFKTFVWLAALERGYTPQSTVIDEPVRLGKWRPANYDRKYRGAVSLSDAFAQSLNTVAAKLTVEAGPKQVAALAKRLGIRAKLQNNASLALGTAEVPLIDMASAYAPLANGGRSVVPHIITRITDADGRVLYERKPARARQVLEHNVVTAMNGMLQQVMLRGTGRAARLKDHPAGGKTGTSQKFRDGLFVGHTAHLVTAVWFGNDDNTPMRKVSGGGLPALTWKNYMTSAHAGQPVKPLGGASSILAALPENMPARIARPTFRPTPVVARKRDVPLRQRVVEATEKARSGIVDLIRERLASR
ncbi:MAG: transglycosylase domain-containing protein [Pseudomonadota bacterium]